jgi:hypothetical protein
VLCTLPSCLTLGVILWGLAHGFQGRALRDGVDFWAGGFLGRHGEFAALTDPAAYNAFLAGTFGRGLPFHLWSYPPNYLLLPTLFSSAWPWVSVLAFDALSLAALAGALRLAGWGGWMIAAVLASPADLENLLAHQNGALMAALLAAGILAVEVLPRFAGVCIGLATIKPQLGIVLPLWLLRRSPAAFGVAVLTAIGVAGLSVAVFGVASWRAFFAVTMPAMSAVLVTGQPAGFADGLVSIYAAARSTGIPAVVQGVVTVGAIALAAGPMRRNAPALLILAPLAAPYLHNYDLVSVAVAIALMVRDGLRPFDKPLFLAAWLVPGLLIWAPALTHAVPVLLLGLLASAARRGRIRSCDSSPAKPGLPA